MIEWQNFFIAQAGAAAALAGLIFVGVSINLTKILSISKLPSRATQPLILLITILVISSLLLVPGQPGWLLGSELILLGGIVWFFTLKIDINIFKNTAPAYRGQFLFNMILTQLAVLPYLIGGTVLLGGHPNGLYCIIPGILFSFIKSALGEWVLLIEINR